MKTYAVYIKQTAMYCVEVQAENEMEARQQGLSNYYASKVDQQKEQYFYYIDSITTEVLPRIKSVEE